MGEVTLSWLPSEYHVLDMGQLYYAVSWHRRVCQLQPDLLDRAANAE